MKKAAIYFIVFICALIIAGTSYADNVQNDIAQNIIRLHIIANSNDDVDQQVKLKVRDGVIACMQEKFNYLSDKADCESIISDNLDYITDTANRILKENGFNYESAAYIGNFNFPTKRYADFILPPGNYEALRIVLGDGNGKNWWCVMFPPLCFIDGENGTVTQAYKNYLKENLSSDSYEIIQASDCNADIQFKFKIIELYQSMIKK